MTTEHYPELLEAIRALRHEDRRRWRQFERQYPELVEAAMRPKPKKPKQRKVLLPPREAGPQPAPKSDDEVSPFHLDLGVIGEPDQRVELLTAAGHGFVIRSVATGVIRTHCRYCGTPLPVVERTFRCEFDSQPIKGCGCNQCELKALWYAGQFRGVGQPRVQCGSDECQRAMDTENKRLLRKRNKRKAVADRESIGGPGSRKGRRDGVGNYSDPTAQLGVWLACDATKEQRELFFGPSSLGIPVKPASEATKRTTWDLFDSGVVNRASMYQAQFVPDLFPKERPMRLENWHPEDLEMYCGDYG